MSTLRLAIGITWAVFWIGWLMAATTAKHGTRAWRQRVPINGLSAIGVVVMFRLVAVGPWQVHSPVVAAIGAAVFAAGLALAVWARIDLGGNWGMPMTQKDEPELVTAGPYRLARHPIYGGLVLAVIGTALATNLIGLAVAALIGANFAYCARVEERNLTTTFPDAYPAYRKRTKMLVPFVF
jgi:protein-S-isoprenylcysteine O-methyltransferase Ste14